MAIAADGGCVGDRFFESLWLGRHYIHSLWSWRPVVDLSKCCGPRQNAKSLAGPPLEYFDA